MAVAFLPSGDTALTVEFGASVDRHLSAAILALHRALAAAEVPGLVETVPSYRSLLIHYDPLIVAQRDLIDVLEPLLASAAEATARPGTHWFLPVCFEPAFATDLDRVATATGQTVADVVGALTTTVHHVYMIGFAPGQPYMGDLPAALSLPRRTTPVPRIEKGAVATAMGLTIVYSMANPTGWHVVGRTPVDLFDLARPEPVLLTPGDAVSLVAIDSAAFADIDAAVTAGSFDLDTLKTP